MPARLLPQLLVFCWALLGAVAALAAPPLTFRIDEGRNLNSFVRAGPVAAHVLLRSGTQPRVLVAFPAGNSGVGLWFTETERSVAWTLAQAPRPVTARDARGRQLHGVEFEAQTDATELRIAGAVLSSIRVLRDFELTGAAPPEVAAAPRVGGAAITWARDRLDGAPGYRLSVEVLGDGTPSADRLSSGAGAPLRLRVRALTGEPPLHPLPALLTRGAREDSRAQHALAFLSYQEKFLAGSWRFDTYFGRDTLISALLLAPVLEPPALESAISSVLERLSPDGEVAHEEDIGEFAVLRNAREGRGRIATPLYDYGMVDDDFLLAPLAARWLLDDARGRARARDFLAARGAVGASHGARLVRNLCWLVQRASAFAREPIAAHLVGIKPGRNTGNWRDSETGLAGGRYAYDVNAALVPAALRATARLLESGLLSDYLDASQRQTLAPTRDFAQVWAARAPGLFSTEISARRARRDVEEYAGEIGVDAEPALRALGTAPLRFPALSLDAAGTPIPVLHSDEGFRWLLSDPPADELAQGLAALSRPFPAGLFTDAGMLVANPAHAAPGLRREFSRFAYHGTVIWSWQQALMAAALDRQWRRQDLPAPLRAQLAQARRELWHLIGNARALRTSELWSWSFAAGRYRAEPFGRPGADADESNAAQLWSTVFLGLSPPDAPAGLQ